MIARIYRPARTAMSSGQAKTHRWVLEFEPERAKSIEPLMGYTSSDDMRSQVRLQFDTKDEAIEYATRPLRDPVARLNREMNEGRVQLPFEARSGFLRGVLRALNVPIESQIVAFSKTSLQSPRITPENPRTLFFNDSVAVGWVNGGFIELAATDPQQGINFYTLQFDRVTEPRFMHQTFCLSCHESFTSFNVPGLLVKSVFPSSDGTAMYRFGSYIPDHRTPFAERWARSKSRSSSMATPSSRSVSGWAISCAAAGTPPCSLPTTVSTAR